MGVVLAAGIVLVAVVVLMLALVRLARRMRRHGVAGHAVAAAMAAYDEAMHVTAHAAYVEMRAQDERAAEARSAADD